VLHRRETNAAVLGSKTIAGSVFVIAAPLPLALGIALDTYVAIARALESNVAAGSIAG